MATIYLAARYIRREELLKYKADLERRGHLVVSRWLEGHHEVEGQAADFASRREAVQFAQEDILDLGRAEVVISFTETPRSPGSVSRGGRHVEFGIGWSWAKTMVVVGPAENVFHLLPTIHRFDDWVLCLANLEALVAVGRERFVPAKALSDA